MKKIMKRIISTLLALCLIMGVVPMNTYAMVGALTNPDIYTPSWEIATDVYKGYQTNWIENQYIRMYWLTETSGKNDENIYLVTVPVKSGTKPSAREAYEMVFDKGVYQRPYFSANSKEITYDSWSIRQNATSLEVTFGFKPYTQIKKLSQKYSYTVKTTYSIVGLDEGKSSGTSEAGIVTHDENDEGTYAIRCAIDVGYEGESSIGYSDELELSYNTEMIGFNRMGHETVSAGPGMYMSTATGSSAEGYTHTTTGIGTDLYHVDTNDLSWWSTPSSGMNSKGTAITEILTKGYSWANPFTALSELYSVYVDGHYINKTYPVDALPGYFSATRSGDVTLEMPLPLQGKQRTYIQGSTLWGFRGLHAMDEPNFTPVDQFEDVAVTAKHLGIYKDNNGYKALPADNEDAIYKKGTPVAVIRGDFEEQNGKYVFTSGVASLSKSVTAVWPVSSGSFSVGKDGSVELSEVGLNAPSFKFFQEKGTGGLTMEPGDDGLVANINPNANSAVIAIDIPGTKVELKGAIIKPNGDLRFTGEAGFALFQGAELAMEELGYGLNKSGQFKFNGIRAKGSISTAEMLGLEMGSLEGEIDTFNKHYYFKLELNVFDLFEADAELELKRFDKTGSLMPNKLYFFVGSEAAKIPLVPPVVVANISGAGGGFDELADTLNGDFFAIPPIKLSITGRGDVLHTIEAKVTYTFGPAYYKMEAEDVSIKILKKLNLIDEFSIYEGVLGETRKYKNTTYTGLRALGGASLHASVPHKSKVFQASGEINASVFGGLDSYRKPKSAYIVADLNGDVKGSVHIPDGVKAIGGTKIASTEIAFYLGASTAVNVDVSEKNLEDIDEIVKAAAESAFENFKVYGGLMKEDNWKVAAWRAYYIFPENDAGFTIKGFWSDMPEWNWEDHIPSSYTACTTEDEGALALVSVSMEPLAASVKENEEKNASVAQTTDYSKTVTLQANAGQTLSKDATVLLMATPAEGTDINEFAKSLTVSKGNQSVPLTWPKYNENEEIINESEINALVTTNGKGKDCVMIGLGENATAGDSWNVTSSVADFDASLNASMPFDSLNMDLNDYSLSGNVENADTTAEYVLATYFGNEKGEMEHLIENTEITDSGNISATIPKEGTMLPTGNYYVTTSLLRKATVEVEDEEGNTSEEEVLLPVDTKEFGAVAYTNTAQPDAPTTAVIKPIGNEIMNASWSEVENADGYKVTIYQENGETYEDTGKGYSYDAADIKAGKISGISYDPIAKQFSLDMALTVAGEDIGENGESKGGTTALEADKNYKIGVQAYKYLTEEGEKIKNSQVYSTETLSNESNLPAYTPVDINVVLQTRNGPARTITEEDGVLSCVAGGGDDNTWYLTPSVKDGTDAEFTVTRMGMDTGIEYTVDPYTGQCCIDNTDIIGSVMFKIDAAVDKGTYTDTTTKYLLVQKDDTAPMFSLDDTEIYANPNTGEYTITGLTEPNMDVYRNTEDNPDKVGTADENGKFSYTGKLELTKEIMVYDENGEPMQDENGEFIMQTVANELSDLVSLFAEDGNGNSSALESAMVTVKKTNTVTLITNGGTIKDGKNVTRYTNGEGVSLPTENDITYAGHKFKGWYDNEALTGSPVTAISSTDTGDKVFYAKWEHIHNGKATITKATASADGKIVKICSVCGKTYETTVIPKVSAIKFQPTDYTYNGKVNTPNLQVVDASGNTIPSSHYTVSFASGRKNVGSYKVTVTFKSSSDKYSGAVDGYFNVNPKGTSISKVSGAKKAFTVKWKKQSKKMAKSKIKGYQIRYSTSSKMTKAKIKNVKGYKKTNMRITKLKAKKKYFVQVRTYMVVNGKQYYSPWSKVKSVKTK
ncbi:MAG: InlB B-repeat-containing protein [Eubacterium sp.]|nr:InlB B-repeat-containing protein [Eubacterium sp.]